MKSHGEYLAVDMAFGVLRRVRKADGRSRRSSSGGRLESQEALASARANAAASSWSARLERSPRAHGFPGAGRLPRPPSLAATLPRWTFKP